MTAFIRHGILSLSWHPTMFPLHRYNDIHELRYLSNLGILNFEKHEIFYQTHEFVVETGNKSMN